MKAAVPIVALGVPLALLGSLGVAHAQAGAAEARPPDATSPHGAEYARPADGNTRERQKAPGSSGTFTDAVGQVRINGPAGTRFERETDSLQGEWEMVCTAPCVAQVSTAFNYRVARWDMKSSKGFALRVDEGQTEELHVDGASYVLWGLGWAVLGTGGAATITGLAIGLISAQSGDSELIPKATTDPALGWIVMGAGVAVAVGGLVLVLTNKRTTVSQDVVEVPRAPETAAATALPMPRLGPVETAAPLVRVAPAFGLRIVSLRF